MSIPENKPSYIAYFSGWKSDLNDPPNINWTNKSNFLDETETTTKFGPYWLSITPNTAFDLNLSEESFLTASQYKNLVGPFLSIENNAQDFFWRIKQFEVKFSISGKAQKKWLLKDGVILNEEEFQSDGEFSYTFTWGDPAQTETITATATSFAKEVNEVEKSCSRNTLRDDGYYQGIQILTDGECTITSGNATVTKIDPDSWIASDSGPLSEEKEFTWVNRYEITHTASDQRVETVFFFSDKKLISFFEPTVVNSQIDTTYKVPFYRIYNEKEPTENIYIGKVLETPKFITPSLYGLPEDYFERPIEFFKPTLFSPVLFPPVLEKPEDWQNHIQKVWPDTPTFFNTTLTSSGRDTIKVCAIHNGKWQKFIYETGETVLSSDPVPFSFTPPDRTIFPQENNLDFLGAKISPHIEFGTAKSQPYSCPENSDGTTEIEPKNDGISEDFFTSLTTVPLEDWNPEDYDQVFQGVFEFPDKSEHPINVYWQIDKRKIFNDITEIFEIARYYSIAADSEIPQITEFSIRPKKWFTFKNQNGLPVFDENTGEMINHPIKNPS